jgi:DNA-binding protein HU-beta
LRLFLKEFGVNRNELVEALAERLQQSRKEAGEALDAVVDEIKKAVAQGENVSIPGFGVFETIAKSATEARERVEEEFAKSPKFKPGTDFQTIIEGAKKVVSGKKTARKSAKTTAKKAPAKTTAKKAPAKTTAKKAPAKTTAKKAPAKTTAKKAPAKKSASK